MLDLRWPMGLMFTIVGAMMFLYGLATFGDEAFCAVAGCFRGISP